MIVATSGELSGAEHISSALVVMPPLKVARVHIHYKHESVLYFTEGWVATLYGPELKPIFHGPGDVVFIPENVIHVGVNLSDVHTAVLLETRTQPDYHEDINVLTELEPEVERIAADLQKQFAAEELPLPADWKRRGFGPYKFTESGS